MGRAMILGADLLGATHFLSEALRAHPKGYCAGVMPRTFGKGKLAKETDLVPKMVQSGLFSEIVVHLAPFDRTHAYPIDRLLKQILADAAYYNSYAARGTKILLSPFCEHNHSAAKMIPVFAKLREVAPNCLLVNSIWKGQEVPSTITEIHLENSKLPRRPRNEDYIVSFDGYGGAGTGDSSDSDIDRVLSYYKDARQVRIWAFRFNGKFGHKDKAPVNARKCWPSVDYIRGHYEIIKGREGAASWPKNALLKPFSDDHGTGDWKDNKLLVIIPESAPFVEVLDSRGRVIEKLARYQPDHTGNPKGARYYSKKYAYQIADIARKDTGSGLISVRVKVGSEFKHYPLTDGDMRSGLWR